MRGFLHFGKHGVVADDLAHHDILLAALAAKAVRARFGGILVEQERRMAWMRNTERAVVAERQLLCNGGGRVENQKACAGLEHGDVDRGELFDERIRNREHNDLRLLERLLDRNNVQTASADALNAFGGVFYEH